MMKLRRQAGFSLVSAIFLLVVLASLGGYMVTVSGVNRTTSSAALQGTRAYQAARSGIEWSVFLILQANNPLDQIPARNICTGTVNGNNFTFNAAGLNSFTVNTSCSFTPHNEQGNDNVTVYTITSIATFGGAYGTPDFVQRRITATISPPPTP